MNNKLIKVIYLFLFLLFSSTVFAQNQVPKPISTNPAPALQNAAKPVKHLRKPRHHAIMPRRITKLQLNRFQGKIDLDDKLKKSNALLYDKL